MRKPFTFGTLFNYGSGNVQDILNSPTFPPFSPSQLNTTDDTDLGKIIMDAYGNIYMKVRYAETSIDGWKGLTVCWKGVYNSIVAGQEPVSGTYSNGSWSFTDSTTTYIANQLKNALVLVCGSVANAYGIIREIYGNTATSSNTVSLTISKELSTSKIKVNDIGIYDGNQLTSDASQINTIPTASTKSIFAAPCYEVVLTNGGSANTKNAIGVLLGTVTAASGSTYYYTWIQIYGVGLVWFKKNIGMGINDTLFGQALFTGTEAGKVTAGTGSTTITDANIGSIIGYSLMATAPSDVLIPVFICPTIRPI